MQYDQEIKDLHKEIQSLKERNLRVEAEKAWETSRTRQLVLVAVTYVVVVLVMLFLKINQPLVNAIIPTVGFYISVQSLPFIKKIWIKKYYG